MTGTERGRPTANRAASKSQLATGDYPQSSPDSTVLARIREQAARDPRKGLRREQRRARRRQRLFELSVVAADPHEPQSFGLSPAELRRHAAELRLQGWSDDEIRARLADPRRVVA
jgi:hypothetical protein